MIKSKYASELSKKICLLLKDNSKHQSMIVEETFRGKKYIYFFNNLNIRIESFDHDFFGCKALTANEKELFMTPSEQIDVLETMINLEINFKRETNTLLQRLEKVKKLEKKGSDPHALGNEMCPELIRYFEVDKDRIKQKMKDCFN